MAHESQSERDRSSSWKIAKLFGVDLKLHWSLLFLLFYIVFISSVQFPFVVHLSGLNPEQASWNPWVFGVVFAIGLFSSVVVHELGHVWVAKNQGSKVHGITLMMLGGFSEIGKPSEKPYGELKLAVMGPLVSFLISGLCWVGYLGLKNRAPQISLLSFWLSHINLMLGVFNLIPALPLDGGRVLRSFLAVKQGNLRATQNAVKVSQVLAWGLGVIGFLQFNFFVVLIALFVYNASESEQNILLTQSVLKGVQVRDAMTWTHPVSESDSLHHAALQMIRTRSQILPVAIVAETEKTNGFILRLDSIRSVERKLWHETRVKELMELTGSTLDVDDSISQAITEMTSHSFQVLPVTEHGKLVGILKYSNLAEMMQFKSLEGDRVDSHDEDYQKAA